MSKLVTKADVDRAWEILVAEPPFDPSKSYGNWVLLSDFAVEKEAVRALVEQMHIAIPAEHRDCIEWRQIEYTEAERRAWWLSDMRAGLIPPDTPPPEGSLWAVGWKYNPNSKKGLTDAVE